MELTVEPQANESIIQSIARIYSERRLGLNDIAKNKWVNKNMSKPISEPPQHTFILLIGDHSTGKSSFINWYYQKEIQNVSVSIETSSITFITSGAYDSTLDGQSTVDKFRILRKIKDIQNYQNHIKTEICLPRCQRPSLVTLIDTPGLIPDRSRLNFDLEDILISLSDYAQLILCFMDSSSQAFSPHLQSYLQKIQKFHRRKLRFFLSKANTIINSVGRSRIVASIAQQLSNLITTSIEVKSFYIPNNNENIEEGNEINYIVNIINNANDEMVMEAIDKLQEDVRNVTIASEKALECIDVMRRRQMYLLMMFLILFVLYVLSYKVKGMFRKWRTKLPMTMICVMLCVLTLMMPKNEEKKQILEFMKLKSKQIRMEINHFYN
ncbi:EH domain-containing protein 3-like protein [Histomonas meleagridis]|uniref:EH domain-containing protein 3-like protein n=1 Tax=Histomonas meleagridis TaxID=135588 RepID=UPI0035598FAE|nr:EH domain-containing protein 3-like protein [Histomonas meleagridis]KAH0799849.1 EH domain-containing protein 3-like protein [Histomonas meleagridis]